MLRLPGLALFAVVLALPAAGQRPEQLYTATRQQLDVTKVVLAQENAWNRGDLDGYLAFYKDGPETEAVLSTAVKGLPAIRQAFHANFSTRDTMGSLEQSGVTVRELGPDYALATGHYRLARTRKSGGDAEGNFTEVFQKTEAGWRLIFSENT